MIIEDEGKLVLRMSTIKRVSKIVGSICAVTFTSIVLVNFSYGMPQAFGASQWGFLLVGSSIVAVFSVFLFGDVYYSFAEFEVDTVGIRKKIRGTVLVEQTWDRYLGMSEVRPPILEFEGGRMKIAYGLIQRPTYSEMAQVFQKGGIAIAESGLPGPTAYMLGWLGILPGKRPRKNSKS